MKNVGTSVCLAILLCGIAGTASAQETATEANHRLRRSINLGNALEAPREGAWGVTIEEKYFDLAKQAGFTAVRIPIRWSAHADTTAPYTIDPQFFNRIDELIQQAQERDLAVIINVHHYNEMNRDPAGHVDRLKALWTQIATHYADHTEGLYFELFNEPTNNMNDAWGGIYPQVIDVIREISPERILIVGPTNWNNFEHLDELNDLTGDPHIIATFHYYLPFEFTHQEAPWVNEEMRPPLGTHWGSDEDRAAMRADFEAAAAWSAEHKLPLFIGEFGAYHTADMDPRIKWTRTVVDLAEEHDMSWAYWELAAGFGIYDPQTQSWRPGLLGALVEQPAEGP